MKSRIQMAFRNGGVSTEACQNRNVSRLCGYCVASRVASCTRYDREFAALSLYRFIALSLLRFFAPPWRALFRSPPHPPVPADPSKALARYTPPLSTYIAFLLQISPRPRCLNPFPVRVLWTGPADQRPSMLQRPCRLSRRCDVGDAEAEPA